MDEELRPSIAEQEYFLREDVEKLRLLALKRQKRMARAEKEELRRLHWMRCPKCGDELHPVDFRNIKIARCFSCHGTWLDEGELEKMAGSNGHKVVDAVLNIFRG